MPVFRDLLVFGITLMSGYVGGRMRICAILDHNGGRGRLIWFIWVNIQIVWVLLFSNAVTLNGVTVTRLWPYALLLIMLSDRNKAVMSTFLVYDGWQKPRNLRLHMFTKTMKN